MAPIYDGHSDPGGCHVIPSRDRPDQQSRCSQQVRLLDGTSLTHTFKAKEQLAAVRLYVELNRQDGGEDPFHLLTSFPRRVFTEDDMEKPLQELGEFGLRAEPEASQALPQEPSQAGPPSIK